MSRKLITLPSGATCVVRKLSALDIASQDGELPLIPVDEPKSSRKAKPQSASRGSSYARLAILLCCSPLRFQDGSRLKVVDKELDQLAPDEITVGELGDDDAHAIFMAVAELSGVPTGKDGAPTASTFPDEAPAQ